MPLAVIRPVCEQRLWPELAVSAGRGDPIDEWDELGDVVAVAGGESGGQRGSLTVADHMVLGARPAAIDWRGACLFAPPFARTCELSTTALDQSNAPASCSSSKSTRCRRSQTPASFQSRKRRQHVIPDPQPISCGRSSHGMPVLRTKRIPVRACRSGTRLRPGYRYRRSTRGNNGSIRAHNPSLTKGFAIDTVYDNSIPKPLFVRRSKYRFEYGQSMSYGSSIPMPEASTGSARLKVSVTQVLSGVTPGFVYHYRLVATNGGGTSYGEDKTFTPGFPSAWDVNGQEALFKKIKSEGKVVLEDRGLGVTAECVVDETGEVYDGDGEVTKMTGSKGENIVSCHLSKTGFCEGSSVEVEAVNLPWKTELIDEPVKNEKGEVLRYEVRNRFYGSAAPGLKWKCKDGSTVLSDSCVGEVSGNVENVSPNVPIEFDAKSPHSTCSGSASGTGTLEGALVFASSEGLTLSASGAPSGPVAPVVVTEAAKGVTKSSAELAGRIVAKGVATTYQFEYGTTTHYGGKIPVSPVSAGDSRLAIGVSQELTGLEANTLYHYRIAATNSAGTTYGGDETFATSYPPEWLINGRRTFGAIKAEGTVVVKNSGLETTVECTIVANGEVGGSTAEIAQITNTKGEGTFTCHTVQGGWCGSAPIEIKATGLPWKQELVDEPLTNEKGEVRYEARLRFYGNSEPGLTLTCDFLGSVASQTCAGETSSATENVVSGVSLGFEAKSEQLSCVGSTIGTTTLEGTLLAKSTAEGEVLSVYGAT